MTHVCKSILLFSSFSFIACDYLKLNWLLRMMVGEDEELGEGDPRAVEEWPPPNSVEVTNKDGSSSRLLFLTVCLHGIITYPILTSYNEQSFYMALPIIFHGNLKLGYSHHGSYFQGFRFS